MAGNCACEGLRISNWASLTGGDEAKLKHSLGTGIISTEGYDFSTAELF
jgi:hypothetical protein